MAFYKVVSRLSLNYGRALKPVILRARLTFTSTVRATSTLSQDQLEVRVIEVHQSGEWKESNVPFEYLIDELRPREGSSKVPVRDFHMLFSQLNLQPTKLDLDWADSKKPAILPRISAGSYFLELEHLRFICRSDKCILIHPVQVAGSSSMMSLTTATDDFVQDLSRNLQSPDGHGSNDKLLAHQGHLSRLLAGQFKAGQLQKPTFEMIVLETALLNVTSRLGHHLESMQSLLDVILEETMTSHPPTRVMLRRTLAFKQNITQFETKLSTIQKALQGVLNSDQDMADLYLTNYMHGKKQAIADHEEIELLLETYSSDLNQLQMDASRMRLALDDADDFINIHLSTTRNEIIRLSLFMNMGMVGLASASLIAGIGGEVSLLALSEFELNMSFLFSGIAGMNLQHGFEEHEHAFYIITGTMILTSTVLFRMLLRRFRNLDSDTSEAKRAQYHMLRNSQCILDEVEARLLRGHHSPSNTVSYEEFETVLKTILPDVRKEEIDLIFKSFDTNRSGVIEVKEIEALINEGRLKRKS